MKSVLGSRRSYSTVVTACFLVLCSAIDRAQDHTVEGGVSLEWDARHDGEAPADLVLIDSSIGGDTLYSLFRRGAANAAKPVDSIVIEATDIPTGALNWEAVFAADSAQFESPVAIEASPDGLAAFVISQDQNSSNVAVIRFDGLDGSASILGIETGILGAGAIAKDIAVSASGDAVFALSETSDESTLTAYDALTGVVLWSNFSVSGVFRPYWLEAGPDRLLLIGLSPPLDVIIEAYDPTSGAALWQTNAGGGFPFDSSLSADGSLLAISALPVAIGPPIPGGTLAFETASGALVFSSPDTGGQVAVSEGGAVVFRARDLGAPSGIETVAFDGGTGAVLWQEQFTSGSSPLLRDMVTHTALGNVTIGMTTTSAVTGPITLLYNYDSATGALTWLQFGDTEGALSLQYEGNGARLLSSGSMPVLLADGTEPQSARQNAYDAGTGSELWDRTAMTTAGTTDTAQAVGQAPDGSMVFVAGTSRNLGGAVKLVAFDSETGTEEWSTENVYSGVQRDLDLTVSSDSQFVYLRTHIDDEQRIFAHSAADGSALWSQTLPDSKHIFTANGVSDIGVSHDGTKVFVCYRRETLSLSPYTGMAVLALDAATGAVLWERFFDLGLGRDDPHALAVAPDDASVLIVGSVQGAGGVTLSLDAATGADQWISSSAVSAGRHAVKVRMSVNGAVVFVAVNRVEELFPKGHSIIAYDRATGAELWVSALDFEIGVWDMQLSDDESRVLVTGTRSYVVLNSFKKDFATISYDATTGIEQWRSEFNSTSWDTSTSIGLGRDGNTVFVTGATSVNRSGLVGGQAFRTIAYDLATGAELWIASYGSKVVGTSYPIGLVVGPNDNRLLVAGTDEFADLALFAYEIPELVTDAEALSLSAGGTTNLGLRPGLGSEGDFYFVLGSTSGTTPGISLGGALVLPLELDAYFWLTLGAKASIFSGFRGSLDGDGLAAASLTIAPGSSPSLAGITLHHAYVAADVLGFPNAVSNAVELRLAP